MIRIFVHMRKISHHLWTYNLLAIGCMYKIIRGHQTENESDTQRRFVPVMEKAFDLIFK